MGQWAQNQVWKCMTKWAVVTMLMMAVVTPAFGTTVPETTATAVEASPIFMLLTDTGGLGDQSFNDSAFKGLTAFAKKSGASRRVLVAKSADDYLPNLVASAEAKSNLTFGVGFLFNQSMAEAAKKYPQQHFAIIDSVVEQDNVASIVFKEEEGSYLVGIAAGLATKSNKIGFVTGMDMPLVKKFEVGFRAGVASVNPKAKVTNVVANSFSDSELGEKIGKDMHQKGIDVVYTAAGNVTIGVAKSAVKYKYWFIGTDTDQSDLAPKNTLCSMIKNIDVATAKIAEYELRGQFKGGIYKFGVAENGVSYSDKVGRLSAETIKVMEQYKKAVASGTIDVPSTNDELVKFKLPKLKIQRPTRVTN